MHVGRQLLEEPSTGAEQYRHLVDDDLVHQSRGQGGSEHTATHQVDVEVPGGRAGSGDRLLDRGSESLR
jgi:hypothetical protein